MYIVVNDFGVPCVVLKGSAVEPFEYLCSNCKQLRLSFVDTDKCGNCGSKDITKGKLGSLKRKG